MLHQTTMIPTLLDVAHCKCPMSVWWVEWVNLSPIENEDDLVYSLGIFPVSWRFFKMQRTSPKKAILAIKVIIEASINKAPAVCPALLSFSVHYYLMMTSPNICRHWAVLCPRIWVRWGSQPWSQPHWVWSRTMTEACPVELSAPLRPTLW